MSRISRIAELQRPDEQGAGSFWVVTWQYGRVAVSPPVARAITTILDRWLPPTWIEFPDRSGSRVRVRTAHVRSLLESTYEQRQQDRAFERAREQEEEGDRRPWDD